MGYNSITVYVHWALSEPQPGAFDFSGLPNFSAFIDIAWTKFGLHYILARAACARVAMPIAPPRCRHCLNAGRVFTFGSSILGPCCVVAFSRVHKHTKAQYEAGDNMCDSR